MSHNPQVYFYPVFYNDRSVSAQVLKLKDYSILINAGIMPPYQKYLQQYYEIMPNIQAVIITNSSTTCCGALPWLQSLGYKGQFFIPQFLFSQVSMNIGLLRSQAILDYYNYIPDDEYIKPLINSQTLFSMELKRDLQLNTYIVMQQSVSVQVRQYAVDSALLLFRTDYFVENLLICSEFYKNSVYKLDANFAADKMDKIQLCCFDPTRRVKRIPVSTRDLIKYSLSCLYQNVQLFCFSDGVNGFLQLFYQLIQYINEINAQQRLRISLICSILDYKQLLENKLIRQYFSENKQPNSKLPLFRFSGQFDDSNIYFVLDCTFYTGFSRLFAASYMSQLSSVKILIGDIGVRYVENDAFVALIKAKLTHKDAILPTQQYNIYIVNDYKPRTLRDELNLAPYELLLEDFQNEQIQSKLDLVQLLDFNSCVEYFKFLDDIFREHDTKLQANKKTLLFTAEQKRFIMDYLNEYKMSGLPLSNYFSSVLVPDCATLDQLVELDQYKNYKIQFQFDKDRPEFVKNDIYCAIMRLFIEVLFDKKMVEKGSAGASIVMESKSVYYQNKSKNTLLRIPVFRNFIDNQPILIQRSEEDFVVKQIDQMQIQKQKATAEVVYTSVVVKCQVDILEFDYYHDVKSGAEMMSRICFQQPGMLNPDDEYLQEMGSNGKYIITEFNRRISYEMQNITHIVRLRFSDATRAQHARFEDGQQFLKYRGCIVLEDDAACAQGLSHFAGHRAACELFGRETSLGEVMKLIDTKAMRAVNGFTQGHHYKMDFCDIYLKVSDNKQKLEEIEIYGRESTEVEGICQLFGSKCGVWCDI